MNMMFYERFKDSKLLKLCLIKKTKHDKLIRFLLVMKLLDEINCILYETMDI